jgi:hypothetical protein
MHAGKTQNPQVGIFNCDSQGTSMAQRMRKIMKRALLNEVLAKEPDKPLYHYTTRRGILGIVGAKEIWVTHTQYLNDRREFLHAIDLTRAEITRGLEARLGGSRCFLSRIYDSSNEFGD